MGIFFVQFFAEIFLVHEKTPAWEVVFLDFGGPDQSRTGDLLRDREAY